MSNQQFFQVAFSSCICLGIVCWIVATVLDILNEHRERERIRRILGKRDTLAPRGRKGGGDEKL